MVDEINIIMKVLSDTIKVSGEMALFGLAGYAIFKLLTIASYLMFAKYVVKTFFDWLKNKPASLKTPTPIDNKTEVMLYNELVRLMGNGNSYIHYDDVRRLQKALDREFNK